MSELLDNQGDTQNENKNTQALIEVAMKIRKVDCHAKKFKKGGLYKAVSEDWRDRFC